MNFVNIDKFLPYVLPYAEKCPQLVARRAIRDTIIDIANRTQMTKIRVELKSKKGYGTYELQMPYGITVGMMDDVTYDGAPLKAINRPMLRQLYPEADLTRLSGEPKYYYHTNSPLVLTLAPAPQDDGKSIVCEVDVSFTREMNDFPEEYYTRYAELVAEGALSRILSMPAQTFTDLGMATQWANMYAEGIRELLMDAYRDFTKEAGKVRVQYRNIL
jgi:hypothetical protein